MIVAAFLGIAAGVGLIVAIRAVLPRREPLADAIARLEHPPPSASRHTQPTGWFTSVASNLHDRGFASSDKVADQLQILDIAPQRHVTAKLTAAIAGLAIPIVFATALTIGGISVNPGWVAVGAGVGAVVGFWWPDLGLAQRVVERQRDFRHALSAYLDLVTIILAGGGGLETALHTAADLGDGWAFTQIRAALTTARITNTTPWDAFDELGHTLGIDELRELAASAHLAGDQGARIRTSLAAKADTLRANQTAAIETQAEAATEKMLLPVVALVVGMILFIGFGVLQAISTPTLPP